MDPDQTATATPAADASATQPATPAAPAAATPTPPPSEPTNAEKAAKMEAIVGKMAGKEPPKPEEPPKEPPKAPETRTDPPKTPPKRVNKVLERKKEIEAKYEALRAELEAKKKEGKPTDIDEYKKTQMEEEYSKILDEQLQEFHREAEAALGDKYEEFNDSNAYYASLLNTYAPAFAEAVGAMENRFAILNEYYNAFNGGVLDFNYFINMPVPRQLAGLRKCDELLRNPPPPAPPAPPQPPPKAQAAVPPPAVPVPTDAAVGTPPADKNARMAQIVSRMSKNL